MKNDEEIRTAYPRARDYIQRNLQACAAELQNWRTTGIRSGRHLEAVANTMKVVDTVRCYSIAEDLVLEATLNACVLDSYQRSLLATARAFVWYVLENTECDAHTVMGIINEIDEVTGGPLSRHPDDYAVDKFAHVMKNKMAASREKGRGGWDDEDQCSTEFLATLLKGHMVKGNPGNFIDIACLAMMLHLRKADPALLLPTPQPTTMTVGTAPTRIWLQVGDQRHYHDEPFPKDTSEVSWCSESMQECEVEYIRADLAGPWYMTE